MKANGSMQCFKIRDDCAMATACEQQYIGKYVKKLQQLTLILKVLFYMGSFTRHWSFLQVILVQNVLLEINLFLLKHGDKYPKTIKQY